MDIYGNEYEYVRIWKVTVLACVKVVSCHSLGETEENNENFSQDSW